MKPRSLRTVAILITGVCLAGCHMSRPADPNRRATAALPGPEAWPERDLDAVRGFADRTPSEIFSWEPNGLVPPGELAPAQRSRLETPDRTMSAVRLTSRGLLRVWDAPPRTQPIRGFSWFPGHSRRFQPNASFLTERDAAGYRLERALEDVPDTVGTPRGEQNYSNPGLQRAYAADTVLLDRGVSLQIPGATGQRGLAVVLGGLLPSVWEDQSVALIAAAGWNVLLVEPGISVRRPNGDAYLRQYDARTDWIVRKWLVGEGDLDAEGRPVLSDKNANRPEEPVDPRAYRAEAEQRFPLPRTGFELTPETDPAQLGRTIAEAVDDTMAENAYAAAAAVGYLTETHGREAVGPIAVIGYSAGSLGAPAVAARLIEEGHDVGALMLIGAGADIFGISQNNPLSRGGIDLVSPGDLAARSPERIGAVHASYLASTRLDPYALAPALADVPTLLMIAADDRLVPNGSLLDERLGYPDRIRYFGGHAGLFFFLPQQTPRMVRWLDRAAPNVP